MLTLEHVAASQFYDNQRWFGKMLWRLFSIGRVFRSGYEQGWKEALMVSDQQIKCPKCNSEHVHSTCQKCGAGFGVIPPEAI